MTIKSKLSQGKSRHFVWVKARTPGAVVPWTARRITMEPRCDFQRASQRQTSVPCHATGHEPEPGLLQPLMARKLPEHSSPPFALETATVLQLKAQKIQKHTLHSKLRAGVCRKLIKSNAF